MPSFSTGVVTRIRSEREGLQRVEVDGAPSYVLTRLIGPVAVGDRVVVNTTAVELGLGTGGWHVVHWNLSRDGWSSAGAGRVLKLRYTSLQVDVGAAEETPGYTPPDDLAGAPVVACALHSQAAIVAAVVAAAVPGRRVAYVMTDSASLPLALSDLVARLRELGIVSTTVTSGQAFGGDHEAVNLSSALQIASGVGGADLIVVGPGPGVVGTRTRLGFSGLEVAAVVDAAARLRARSVVAVRYSDADHRPRHQGISDHTLAALAAAARPALVAVPRGERGLDALAGGPHALVEVDVGDVAAVLDRCRLDVTTMGRSAHDDPGYFRWAAAAGVVAAQLLGAP
jgi:hypothetical protein